MAPSLRSAAVFALTLACGKPDPGEVTKSLWKSQKTPDQALALLADQGLPSIFGAKAGQSATLLAGGWEEFYAGLHNCSFCAVGYEEDPERAIALAMAEPDFFCSKEAKAASEKERPPWPAAVKMCGRDYYHLPAGLEFLLTPKWYSFRKVVASIQKAREAAAPETRAAYDYALAENPLHAVFQLPGRVDGLFSLAPTAAPPLGRDPRELYLIATRDALLLGSWPSARLLPEGPKLDEIGAPWPGARVAAGELEREIEELRAERASAFVRFAPVPQAEPFWRSENEYKEVPAKAAPARKGTAAGLYAMKGPGDGPTKREATPKRSEVPFLLFVDQDLPSSRMVEVLRALPGLVFVLAAEGRAGLAEEHPLQVYTAEAAPAAGALTELSLTAEGCRVSLAGEEGALIPAGDAAAIRARLREGADPEKKGVAIVLGDAVPVREAFRLFDIVAEAGFTHALVSGPSPAR